MNIDQILKAADKATAGVWSENGCEIRSDGRIAICEVFTVDADEGKHRGCGESDFNSRLIAGAPQLAAEVRRLRERERVLVDALTWYERWVGECAKIGADGDRARGILDRDIGEKARAALEAVKE
jgi:hypothetical protein